MLKLWLRQSLEHKQSRDPYNRLGPNRVDQTNVQAIVRMHVKGANGREKLFALAPKSGKSTMAPAIPATRPLVTKLLNYGPLSPDEQTALDQAGSSFREFASGEDMVLEGSFAGSAT